MMDYDRLTLLNEAARCLRRAAAIIATLDADRPVPIGSDDDLAAMLHAVRRMSGGNLHVALVTLVAQQMEARKFTEPYKWQEAA